MSSTILHSPYAGTLLFPLNHCLFVIPLGTADCLTDIDRHVLSIIMCYPLFVRLGWVG